MGERARGRRGVQRGGALGNSTSRLSITDGTYGTNGTYGGSVTLDFSVERAAEYRGAAGIFCCRSLHRSHMPDAFVSDAG
jgi:hypothetical protein